MNLVIASADSNLTTLIDIYKAVTSTSKFVFPASRSQMFTDIEEMKNSLAAIGFDDVGESLASLEKSQSMASIRNVENVENPDKTNGEVGSVQTSEHSEHQRRLAYSAQNLSLRWEAYQSISLTTHSGRYNYVRIKSEKITGIKSVNHSEPIFILPTDDEQFNIFVTKLSTEDGEKIAPGPLGVFRYVEDIFRSLEADENLDAIKEVFIPAFDVGESYPVDVKWIQNLDILSQSLVDGEERSDSGEAESENNKLRIHSIRNAIGKSMLKLHSQPSIGSPKIVPGGISYVLDSCFLFGISSNKVDEALDIPLYSAVIKEEWWCK